MAQPEPEYRERGDSDGGGHHDHERDPVGGRADRQRGPAARSGAEAREVKGPRTARDAGAPHRRTEIPCPELFELSGHGLGTVIPPPGRAPAPLIHVVGRRDSPSGRTTDETLPGGRSRGGGREPSSRNVVAGRFRSRPMPSLL